VRGPWPDEVVVSYPTNFTPPKLQQHHHETFQACMIELSTLVMT